MTKGLLKQSLVAQCLIDLIAAHSTSFTNRAQATLRTAFGSWTIDALLDFPHGVGSQCGNSQRQQAKSETSTRTTVHHLP